jgi:hypothetical protein
MAKTPHSTFAASKCKDNLYDYTRQKIEVNACVPSRALFPCLLRAARVTEKPSSFVPK